MIRLVVLVAAATLISGPAATAKTKPKPRPVRHVTMHTYPLGSIRTFGYEVVSCTKPALPKTAGDYDLGPGQTARIPRSKTGLRYIVVVRCVDNTPPPPPPPTPVTLNFSGNGTLQLAPFTVPLGEQFCWTSNWPDGASLGDPNGDFSAADNGASGFVVSASNQPSGCSYIGAGTYQLTINDEGSWTISIHP